MAKQNKPTGGEKADKIDAKIADTKIDDTGPAIVTPWDPKTGPAAGDKIASKGTAPKNKASDASAKGAQDVKDLEKKKKVAEALIGLEDMDDVQMAKLSAMLEAFKEKDDDEKKDTDDTDDTDDDEKKEEKDDTNDDDDKKDDDPKKGDCGGDPKVGKKGDKKPSFPFKKEDIVLDMKEDVDAMFEGQDLSEEFRTKAILVFESAVKSRINGIVDTVQAAYVSAVESGIESGMVQLEEKLTGYMQYVSEEYIKENELAIESGIRTEVTEEFITGFKTLCEEHSIEIPLDKVDALEESKKEFAILEKKFTTLAEENISLKNDNNQSVRMEVLSNISDGLADTEKEKLSEVCESIDYESKEDFAKKATILKESYFPKATSKSKSNDLITEDDDEQVKTGMSKYTNRISHDLKNA